MTVNELEPELDELLQRLIPNITNEWKGAESEEIDLIERMIKKVSGQEMPKFYRWFLMRMGQSMGSLETPGLDYSASTVISLNEDEVHNNDEDQFFLIAHSTDEVLPLNMYYDLEYPIRNCARVTKRASDGGDDFKQFETFREMIAWNSMLTFRVEKFPHLCKGTLYDERGENVFLKFDPVMTSLGFEKSSIPTGSLCGLYDSKESAMVTLDSIDFGSEISDGFAFTLGGEARTLRAILGRIDAETDLILDVKNDPRQLRDA